MAGRTTSGVDVGTGTGSGIDFSLLLKGIIAFIVILAVGFIVTSSLSGNDAEGRDQKVPDKTDIDPASGGVAGAGGVTGVGIVTGDEALEDTSGEIGYTRTDYPIDNIPAIIALNEYDLAPDGDLYHNRYLLDEFKILNLRHEDNKFKFCVKNPTSKTYYQVFSANAGEIGTGGYAMASIEIIVPPGKTTCYEASTKYFEDRGTNIEYIRIDIK